MLRSLHLECFKCFRSQQFPLNRLTVLSGLNASGKSSMLQGLVLLSQTMRDQEWSSRLYLNGNDLQLGSMTDIVNNIVGRRSFAIEVEGETGIIGWTFESDDRRAMAPEVSRVKLGSQTIASPNRLQRLLPEGASPAEREIARTLARLAYLTAERLGPRDLYALQEPGDGVNVGSKGELAVSLLYSRRDQQVLPQLTLDGHAPTLLRQVEARMVTFFPGCALELSPVPQTNSVTLGIRTSEATAFHRPTHVGFGLTQVLPILVAALSSDPGQLVLLENPEVHLHPAGQAKMGMFLAEAAQAGVQVVLETHSDHILSGIRRAVKGGSITPEQVSLLFVVPGDDGIPLVTSPMLDVQGNIDHWPEGFFDQFDKDASFFAGWGD